LQNQLISVGWPCIGFTSSAVLAKEIFQSGVLELRGMSCRSGLQLPSPSLPLHFKSFDFCASGASEYLLERN
jgi:hypothetical protein